MPQKIQKTSIQGGSGSAERSLPGREQLAALSLASGAGLVAHILTGLSLPLGVALAALPWLAAALTVCRRATPTTRSQIRRRALAGLVAGLLATIAYDLSRAAIAAVFQLPVSPFKAFPHFGRALVGAEAPLPVAVAVGSLFHLLNGCSFGVGYAFLSRRLGPGSGLLFGIFLEAAMVALYPSFLDLRAVMQEFIAVSFAGHVVYGCLLGSTARRLLLAKEVEKNHVPDNAA